jgi:hypothetical protein
MKNSSSHFVRDAVYADWVSARRISCGSTSGNRATMSLSSCRDDQPRALAASRRHLREGIGEQRVFALSFPGAPLSGAQGRHSDALGAAPCVIVSSSHFARRSCNRPLPTEYRSAVPRLSRVVNYSIAAGYALGHALAARLVHTEAARKAVSVGIAS